MFRYSVLSPAALSAESRTASPTQMPQERIREIDSANVPGYPFFLARISSPNEPVNRSWQVLATDLPTDSSIATSGHWRSSARAITDASPGSRVLSSQRGIASSFVQTRMHVGSGVVAPGVSFAPHRTSSRTTCVTTIGCSRTFNTSHDPVAAARAIKTPVSNGREASDTGVLRDLVRIGHGGRQSQRPRLQNKIASGKPGHIRRLAGSDFPLLEKPCGQEQTGFLLKFLFRHPQSARQRVGIGNSKCVWHMNPF